MRFWVAYSGGQDSHVLLHALAALVPCQAIHVNHGLHQQADNWTTHCQQVCDALKVPLITEKLSTFHKPGESLEASARSARYQVFEKHLASDDVLLLAHHQADQAETFLLQLMRGAGPTGLSAMPIHRALGQGFCARPLLDTPKAAIEAYAKKHQLQWIEDPSNQQRHLRRNAVRHQVLPLLESMMPNVTQNIARSAKHCATLHSLGETLLDADYQPCIDENNLLLLKNLSKLDIFKQKLILRKWLKAQGITMPSAVQLDIMLKQMLYAKQDSNPEFKLAEGFLRRYRGKLYFCPHHSKEWAFKLCQGEGIALNKLTEPLSIQYRKGKTIKKRFQTLGIPPWEREDIPLIYCGDTLIAMGYHFVDNSFQVNESQDAGLKIMIQKQHITEFDQFIDIGINQLEQKKYILGNESREKMHQKIKKISKNQES